MNLERCTLHKLPLSDPGKAADDPALALLLRDGWTVISDVPIADRDDPHVLLFLAPPDRSPASRPWLGVLGVALGAVSVGLWIATLVGVA